VNVNTFTDCHTLINNKVNKFYFKRILIRLCFLFQILQNLNNSFTQSPHELFDNKRIVEIKHKAIENV